MAVAVENNYQVALEEQKTEVRNLVVAGLEQIKEGKTKDFNAVCDRLEKNIRVRRYRIEITELADDRV